MGCGSSSDGTDVDTMINNMVEDVSAEADTVAQEYELAQPAQENILDALATCLENGRSCKKECHKVNSDLEPFHAAIHKCKEDFRTCRKDEAQDPQQCRATAKSCVKTAIETRKPFVDCMKTCVGEFKTCIGDLHPQRPAHDQPGIREDIKECLEANGACQKDCLKDLGDLLKPCRDGFDTCLAGTDDPLQCKEAFLACEQPIRETAPVANQECLGKCIESFKTCMGEIKPPEQPAEPPVAPRPCEIAREMEKCIVASRECQKACTQDLGAVLNACREGFDSCMKPANADPVACRTGLKECTEKALQSLPTTNQDCLTHCGDGFTTCVDAL